MRAQVVANWRALIKVHLSRLMLNKTILTQTCSNSTFNQVKPNWACQPNTRNETPVVRHFFPLSYLEFIPLYILRQSYIKLHETIKMNFLLEETYMYTFLFIFLVHHDRMPRNNDAI